MPSSTVIIPILFTSGLGALGTGAVSLARWRAFENKHPTVGTTFYGEGHLWNPLSGPKNSRMRVSRNEKMVDFTNWNCFQRMFPGLEIKQNEVSEDTAITKPSESEQTSEGKQEKAIACAIMDLQPVAPAKGGTKNYFYYFKTELVVKGENTAIALWAALTNRPTGEGARNTEDDDKSRFKFVWRAVSLIKTGDTWKIDSGYQWDNYSNQKGGFYVRPPGEEDYWLYQAMFKDREYVYPKRWMGVWEVFDDEDENTSGLFSGVQVYRYHMNQAEVLGKSVGKIGEANAAVVVGEQKEGENHKFGYSSVNIFYDAAGDKGWVKSSGQPVDISNWLRVKYAPFDKQQGKWTELYTRCSDLYWNRDLTDASVERMKGFCYNILDKNS